MPGGRPTELNEHVEAIIIERIQAGMPVSHAAQSAGITHQTLNNWKRRGQREPDTIYGQFFSAVKKAESELMFQCLQTVRGGAKGWQSCAWILERKWPELWSTDRELLSELKQFLKQRKKERRHEAGEKSA